LFKQDIRSHTAQLHDITHVEITGFHEHIKSTLNVELKSVISSPKLHNGVQLHFMWELYRRRDSKGRVKLSSCLTKYHAMKTYPVLD